MRGKIRARELVIPPSFGLPPRIQNTSRGERGERRRGAVGVGGLAVVDEERRAPAGRSPPGDAASRETCAARRQRRRGDDAEDQCAHALAASAFCMLCRPRSEPMPARSAKAPSGPVQGARAMSSLPTRVPAVGHALARRYEIDPAALGEPQPLGDVAAPVVVLADDGAARQRLDQARLERRRSAPSCRDDRDDRARC